MEGRLTFEVLKNLVFKLENVLALVLLLHLESNIFVKASVVGLVKHIPRRAIWLLLLTSRLGRTLSCVPPRPLLRTTLRFLIPSLPQRAW